MSNGYSNEKQERRELPATGFRFWRADPEYISSNTVIHVQEMKDWLEAEIKSNENITKDKDGNDIIRLAMRECKPTSKAAFWLAYDDFDPSKGPKKATPQRNNVTPMPATSIPEDDIPF